MLLDFRLVVTPKGEGGKGDFSKSWLLCVVNLRKKSLWFGSVALRYYSSKESKRKKEKEKSTASNFTAEVNAFSLWPWNPSRYGCNLPFQSSTSFLLWGFLFAQRSKCPLWNSGYLHFSGRRSIALIKGDPPPKRGRERSPNLQPFKWSLDLNSDFLDPLWDVTPVSRFCQVTSTTKSRLILQSQATPHPPSHSCLSGGRLAVYRGVG